MLANDPLLFILQGELGAGKTQFAKGIGKISGTVTDGKGNPVNGAYLNIGDSSYTFWRSTQTNASGTYAFSDVPEGKYKISF